jgi:hypothetical protein
MELAQASHLRLRQQPFLQVYLRLQHLLAQRLVMVRSLLLFQVEAAMDLQLQPIPSSQNQVA